MAAERLSMRKIREVLRLQAQGLSRRTIGRSLGICHNTAGAYLERAQQAGLCWAECQEMDDAALEARLFPPAPPSGTPRPLPEWSVVQQEMRKKGVTLQLLWLEYKAAHPGGYQYTRVSPLFTGAGRSRSTWCCARSTRPASGPSSTTPGRPFLWL